ncbi:MAG: squalene--hopene cyclase [Verrucomicrobia bacterium]|nr:squalene--hopene cyclase [Verrucomicrobiota bacterium]
MNSAPQTNTPAGCSRLDVACATAVRTLLAERHTSGKWIGELSSSALSTATAVCALAVLTRNSKAPDPRHQQLIATGLDWLAGNQNADGGWGDTLLSISNISTTALCWAAFGAVLDADFRYAENCLRARQWLTKAANGESIGQLVSAIEKRYGKDRTFSVPILMTCVLGNRLGSGREAWERIPSLPFELAVFPHQVYGALQLPVVSYALPALIAIGQTLFHHCPPKNPIPRLIRHLTKKRTLKILAKIQPENGGFLEAIPLTSFVLMSLAAMELSAHPAAIKAVGFLERSVRADGSWPIDSNLSTWVTTLAINALQSETSRVLDEKDAAALAALLIGEQHKIEHPYTHAKPGGWAWTELPGGVPDSDDTAGAVLALFHLRHAHPGTLDAATAGLTWLLGVQNRDGGIPTFCRGWGALPFDRSSQDITAHFIRAAYAWSPHLNATFLEKLRQGITKAVAYLKRVQNENGSWVPLWFGNQASPDDENPVYGTSRVLLALSALDTQSPMLQRSLDRGLQWLLSAQNADGGWGGSTNIPSSTEETALAVESISAVLRIPILSIQTKTATLAAAERGTEYLIRKVESGEWPQPAPIGFYFAKLWYYERLYPLVFTSGALRAVRETREVRITQEGQH